MNKIVFISVLYACFAGAAVAQSGLTQSAEGKSSILFRGNDITFDLTKTELSVGFNNLRQTVGRNEQPIFGVSGRAKNAESIGNLFAKGDFIPSSNIDLFAGWSFSNATPRPGSYVAVRSEEIRVQKAVEKRSFAALLPKYTRDIVDEAVQKHVSDSADSDSLEIQLLRGMEDISLAVEYRKYIEGFKFEGDPNNTEAVEKAIEEIKKAIKEEGESHDAVLAAIDQQKAILEEAFEKTPFWLLQVFGFGGINALDFKRFIMYDTANFANSFNDVYFRGGRFGAGVNLQYQQFLFGLTYCYKATNNFNLLDKAEYKYQSKQGSDNETITREKSITAYSGAYGEVEINELNIDLAWHFMADSSSKLSVLVNPYIRAEIASRNSVLLPNKINIGTGLYLFNLEGKFMGGVYVELPDLENNYEKLKPADKQNLRPHLQRMNFGIVGKFSLSSTIAAFTRGNPD